MEGSGRPWWIYRLAGESFEIILWERAWDISTNTLSCDGHIRQNVRAEHLLLANILRITFRVMNWDMLEKIHTTYMRQIWLWYTFVEPMFKEAHKQVGKSAKMCSWDGALIGGSGLWGEVGNIVITFLKNLKERRSYYDLQDSNSTNYFEKKTDFSKLDWRGRRDVSGNLGWKQWEGM